MLGVILNHCSCKTLGQKSQQISSLLEAELAYCLTFLVRGNKIYKHNYQNLKGISECEPFLHVFSAWFQAGRVK